MASFRLSIKVTVAHKGLFSSCFLLFLLCSGALSRDIVFLQVLLSGHPFWQPTA